MIKMNKYWNYTQKKIKKVFWTILYGMYLLLLKIDVKKVSFRKDRSHS